MNEEFSEDSDSSDEDYVPTNAAPGEVLSEVDSDGDPEEPLSDDEDAPPRAKRHKKPKPSKKNGKTVPAEAPADSTSTPDAPTNPEDKKKHADDLWASFKKDTGFKKKSAKEGEKCDSTSTSPGTTAKITDQKVEGKKDTVKVTQLFEFAGEVVHVEKEVRSDSAEARLNTSNSSSSGSSGRSSEQITSTSSPASGPRKRGGLGGIGSVLGQLGKKQKLSTLEKTKLDWGRFKKQEDIEDELESYKKGKDGYLERQDFLQRADLRTFEIEKSARDVERAKRFNSTQ